MKYFSVTKVLQPFADFSKIPPHVLAYAADRGTRVHRICLNVYAKGIPVMNVPDDCYGFFLSFTTWFDQYVAEVLHIEKEFVDRRFGFVGHVDMICLLNDGRIVIVDLKTPAIESPSWKLQLAAYREAVNQEFCVQAAGQQPIEVPAKNGCMSLLLNKDGKRAKASVYQYSNDDFAVFLSALNVYRYFN